MLSVEKVGMEEGGAAEFLALSARRTCERTPAKTSAAKHKMPSCHLTIADFIGFLLAFKAVPILKRLRKNVFCHSETCFSPRNLSLGWTSIEERFLASLGMTKM